MEREEIIRDLQGQIVDMCRLHTRYGLHESEGFRRHKEAVTRTVREHSIDVRHELDPMIGLIYRRYFE